MVFPSRGCLLYCWYISCRFACVVEDCIFTVEMSITWGWSKNLIVPTQMRFLSLTFERLKFHCWILYALCCCPNQAEDNLLLKETVWPISQVLFFTAVILTRPAVTTLTLRRRKPSSTALGNSQSNLAYLFNIAVSVFVELVAFFFSYLVSLFLLSWWWVSGWVGRFAREFPLLFTPVT